jgi:hypothetical protein
MALGDPEIELGAPTIVMGKPRIELQSSGVFASGTQPTISMAAPRIILGDAKVELVVIVVSIPLHCSIVTTGTD